MQIKRVSYTPNFQKNWRKLPGSVRKKAIKKEKQFRQDAFFPSLFTHKLTGKLQDYWSFSIDYKHRIVFRFLQEGAVLFVDVGTHGIYK